MRAWQAVLMAFSMFSRIPVPAPKWSEENMRWLLAAFPLVGAAVGLMLLLWQAACGWLGLSPLVWAAGATLLPLLLTGGIHMDGLADVADALGSHAAPQRKREILKDSHIGAFGVMAISGFLLSYFALASQLAPTAKTAALLLCSHMLSRTGSGLCSLCFASTAKEGLLCSFRASAEKRGGVMVLWLWATVCVAGLCALLGWRGLLPPLGAACAALYVRRMSVKEFGGMSGDISGFYLQVTELTTLLIFVALEGAGQA